MTGAGPGIYEFIVPKQQQKNDENCKKKKWRPKV
jgi:hypothetical protein